MSRMTYVLGASREALHRAACEFTPHQRADHEKWLNDRPPNVKAVAEKLNMMAVWRIKDGAPYVFTQGGTIGVIQGFRECDDDVVRVLFVAHIMVTDDPRAAELDGPIVTPIEVEWMEEDPSPWTS